MIGQRAAYQLIGFGVALAGVGVLNLAAQRWNAEMFRSRIRRAAVTYPEAFGRLRATLRHEEGLA